MHHTKKNQTQHERVESEIINLIFSEIEKGVKKDLHYENYKNKFCIAIRDIIIKEKIYRNPTLTRDSLIKRLGTSKDLFVKGFQYCFGMSFHMFIVKIRLKEAMILLEESDLSIEEISEKVGFGSVRTFQRQFQSKYNTSPKDYRKAKQE